MKNEIGEIIDHYQAKKGALIPILQHIQKKFGYISQEAISVLSRQTKISESEIYGVSTFYTQFKFQKPGRHQIKVCQGTACHVKGSAMLMDTVKINLGIEPGETTKDGNFSLERVACLGCCALAPVIVVDEEVHGKMTQDAVGKTLKSFKESTEPKEDDPDA